MAMSYEQSAQLMTDLAFRGRCKVAVLKYADALASGGRPIPGGNSLLRWAQQTFQQPDIVAQQVQGPVVMDGAVQEYGSDINDGNLQAAVEATVNKMV